MKTVKYSRSFIYNLEMRCFTSKITAEFNPEAPDFNFRLSDHYLLSHSGDRINTPEAFANIINDGIGIQGSRAYLNVQRLTELDLEIADAQSVVEKFEPIDSAFAPTLEEVTSNLERLEGEREEILDANSEIEEIITTLTEILDMGSEIIREMLLDGGIMVMSFGLIIVLIKLVKTSHAPLRKILDFVKKILLPIYKTEERVKSNVLDTIEYYSGDNKDVLILLGALTLTLNAFRKKGRATLLRILEASGDKNNEFIKAFIDNLKHRQQYDKESSKVLKDALEKSLINYDDSEGFREFSDSLFNADQQLPSYQKYMAFQDMVFGYRNVNRFSGITNNKEEFKQKTVTYKKKKNGIKKGKLDFLGDFLRFFKYPKKK